MSDSVRLLRKLNKPSIAPAVSKPKTEFTPKQVEIIEDTIARLIESSLKQREERCEDVMDYKPIREVQRQAQYYACRCGFHASSTANRPQHISCPCCGQHIKGGLS